MFSFENFIRFCVQYPHIYFYKSVAYANVQHAICPWYQKESLGASLINVRSKKLSSMLQ